MKFNILVAATLAAAPIPEVAAHSGMGETMKGVLPDIEQTTRLAALYSEDKTLLQYNQPSGSVRSFYETKGYLADSSFF